MSPSDPLRVTVRRSGGFAGLERAFMIDAGQLDPADADQLRQLVDATGLAAASPEPDPSLGTSPAVSAPNPDAFAYELEVRDGDVLRTATVSPAGGAGWELARFALDRAGGPSPPPEAPTLPGTADEPAGRPRRARSGPAEERPGSTGQGGG